MTQNRDRSQQVHGPTAPTRTPLPEQRATPGHILVLGGTGKTGRRVASRLRARGITVRATSRSGPDAFDWSRPATWDAVLTGVPVRCVTFQPDLAVPGAGVPEPDAAFLAHTFAGLFDGPNAAVTDGGAQLLGRDPRSFASFVSRAGEAGLFAPDPALR